MIIDAVMFGGELDILELRLHELDRVVDKFIVVESLEHHGSDRAKGAILAENWDVVKPFEHKLKYVVLPHLQPAHRGPNDSWPRENFHRNALFDSLPDVSRSDDDIILISDCDEIPRAQTVLYALPILQSSIHSFRQDFYYYNVNNYLGTWHGTCGGTIRAMKAFGGPQAVRNNRDSWTEIDELGGWHFSYFGGINRILRKLENFAHACEDSSRLVLCRDRQELINDILIGADIYQRLGEGRKELRATDDSRLPDYFRVNQHRFPLFTEAGLREALR